MTVWCVANRRTMRVLCESRSHSNRIYSESVYALDGHKVKGYKERRFAVQAADKFNKEWLSGTDRKKVGRYELIEINRLKEMENEEGNEQ